jgi:hypothetical protein
MKARGSFYGRAETSHEANYLGSSLEANRKKCLAPRREAPRALVGICFNLPIEDWLCSNPDADGSWRNR